MKNLILITCLLLSLVNCRSEKEKNDQLYLTALEKYTNAIDTFYSKYSNQFGDKIIYLERPSFISQIPTHINGYSVVLIDSSNITKIYLAHHRRLIHTTISKLVLEKDLVKITITPMLGEMKETDLISSEISDGTTIYFKYNFIRQAYDFCKMDNWGM